MRHFFIPCPLSTTPFFHRGSLPKPKPAEAKKQRRDEGQVEAESEKVDGMIEAAIGHITDGRCRITSLVAWLEQGAVAALQDGIHRRNAVLEASPALSSAWLRGHYGRRQTPMRVEWQARSYQACPTPHLLRVPLELEQMDRSGSRRRCTKVKGVEGIRQELLECYMLLYLRSVLDWEALSELAALKEAMHVVVRQGSAYFASSRKSAIWEVSEPGNEAAMAGSLNQARSRTAHNTFAIEVPMILHPFGGQPYQFLLPNLNLEPTNSAVKKLVEGVV
ncbi:hypothetical protein BKA70DRAFT_1238730 [Coprinopsis sp. MPI-PUGE-AT-0042]|nr:hypothetical protein BKA70DRAFT_1238730 [Coprinopsis sp. MPI-PUGE-AT-0042]